MNYNTGLHQQYLMKKSGNKIAMNSKQKFSQLLVGALKRLLGGSWMHLSAQQPALTVSLPE
jgi:hypothetical protein